MLIEHNDFPFASAQLCFTILASKTITLASNLVAPLQGHKQVAGNCFLDFMGTVLEEESNLVHNMLCLHNNLY